MFEFPQRLTHKLRNINISLRFFMVFGFLFATLPLMGFLALLEEIIERVT